MRPDRLLAQHIADTTPAPRATPGRSWLWSTAFMALVIAALFLLGPRC